MAKATAYFRCLLLFIFLLFTAPSTKGYNLPGFDGGNCPSSGTPVAMANLPAQLLRGTQASTTPSITIDSEMSAFSAYVGSKHEPDQYYFVKGSFLAPHQKIKVAVSDPSGSFTVSLDGAPDTYTTSVELSANGDGWVEEALIFVKYEPAVPGKHVAMLQHTTEGVEPKTLSVEGTATEAEPMPVELVSFEAELLGNYVVLNWATASEQENSHFEVEVSDSRFDDFKKIGSVSSKNTNSSVLSTYSFRHPLSAKTGICYFRLKQVDLDSTFTYSKVIAIESPERHREPNITVAPNPLTSSSQLTFVATEPGLLKIKVTDMSGTDVFTTSHPIFTGENIIALNLHDKIKPGAYILTTAFKNQAKRVKLLKD